MKNPKLKFSEYMLNISRSKSFGKFVLIVNVKMSAWVHCYTCCHMILAEVAKFFWDLFPSSFQYWPSSTKFAKLAALSAFSLQ